MIPLILYSPAYTVFPVVAEPVQFTRLFTRLKDGANLLVHTTSFSPWFKETTVQDFLYCAVTIEAVTLYAEMNSTTGVEGFPMNASDTTPLSWRDLYLAAVFETSKNQIPLRIELAEKAIVSRSRELFASDANRAERDLLQSALVGLHAWRSSLVRGDLPRTRAA